MVRMSRSPCVSAILLALLSGSIGACGSAGQSGGDGGQSDSSMPSGSTDAAGDAAVPSVGSEASTSSDALGAPAADMSVDASSTSLSDSGASAPDSDASAPDSGLGARDSSGADAPRTDAADSSVDAPSVGDAASLRFTCPAGPFTTPTLTGLTPTKIAGVPPSDTFNNDNGGTSFSILEGPVWIGDSLCLSELANAANPPPGRILQVTSAGAVSVAIASSGSNGLAVDKNNNLYATVDTSESIERYDLSTGMATPIVTEYMGKRFDSPNDLAIRSDGNIYFSDPDDQAPTPAPQAATRVYRVAPGTNAVSVIDATLSEPNGVTLSIDENTLYVTSTYGLYSYPVMADGSVGAGTLVTDTINGDGMAIDCAGDLYIAVINTLNVVVLNPAGTQIGVISLPADSVQSVTNAAFGGADHQTLYITALGSGSKKGLFEVPMSIPGMPY